MARVETLESFALMCHKILRSDRDVNIAIGGFTGEGKSTCLTKIFQAYSKVSGVKWDFNFMTWSRKELLAWIDGKKGGKVLPSGLVEKQLPEYSAINIDELWLLFYKRNWYDEGQIDSLATLNMCRDRHLLIGGNVPNFWDLDSAFSSRIRFYIYVVRRGVAWVFEQENNPFSVDAWNKNYNRMLFRKIKNPYLIPNFVCELNFPDWLPSEKLKYYEIRNKKRVLAIEQGKGEKIERYSKVKKQRDTLLRMLFNIDEKFRENKEFIELFEWEKLTNKGVGDAIDLSISAVHLIRLGAR